MSASAIALGAGCALLLSETVISVRPDGDEPASPSIAGAIERTHLELVADPTCEAITLVLPPGVGLQNMVGREKRGDGTRVVLGAERWIWSDRSVTGAGTATLLLPDLLGGDRVTLDFERVYPLEPIVLAPGAARFVSVEVQGEAELTSSSKMQVDRKGGWWSSDAEPNLEVRIAPSGSQPTRALLSSPGLVEIERRMVLTVPQGDPQLRLHPGGGSTVSIEDFLSFSPSRVARGWPLPAPVDVDVRMRVVPADSAVLVRDPAGWSLMLPPSEGPAKVTVSWTQPDAPTYGERDGSLTALTVDAPDGEIVWEGDAWYLLGVNKRGVTPDRERLTKALETRFRNAALPEPGAPINLRGREPTWELAADLRPALWDRIAPAPIEEDPLWPRPLVRARKSGVLSSTEAALVTWLYARQQRLDASWAIARPASAGPAATLSLAGYTRGLVRVQIDGETRWMDPSCTVCAAFELPADLYGADVIGAGSSRTPEPPQGRHDVVLTDDRVTWSLSGPPALLLREWIQPIPTELRASSLATRVGGPGARLVALEGLDAAGTDIRVETTRGTGLLADPIELPVARDDGAWLEWIGERTLLRSDDGPEGTFEGTALSWRRTRTPEGSHEVLTVRDRAVPAADLSGLDASRRARPAPPSPPEPDPGSP